VKVAKIFLLGDEEENQVIGVKRHLMAKVVTGERRQQPAAVSLQYHGIEDLHHQHEQQRGERVAVGIFKRTQIKSISARIPL